MVHHVGVAGKQLPEFTILPKLPKVFFCCPPIAILLVIKLPKLTLFQLSKNLRSKIGKQEELEDILEN